MISRTNFRSLLIGVSLLAFAGAAFADSSLRAIDEAIAAADYDQALELIDTQLEANPGDPALRLRHARVLAYSGNIDAALGALNDLRRDYPHDVDYAFARAQLYARRARDREALDDLRQATALAPDYEEVWQLRHSVLSRQHDEAAQFELAALLREVAVRFPRASWWRNAESDSVARWMVLVGAGHEDLSNDDPSWNQQFIEVSRAQDSGRRYRVGVARDARFDNSDLSVLLGGDFTFASNWSAGADITMVGDPNFQPDLSISGNIGRSLADGWVVNLRYRRREYETATVGSTVAAVEKYIDDFRIAYALGLSHLHGASNSLNHSLTANWYYNDRSSVGVSLNTGMETEAVGPGQVLETDVRGVSVNGRRRLTDRLDLHWWLGVHDQGDFYRRRYLGMAVSIRL